MYDVSAKEKSGDYWYNDVHNVWFPAYKQAGIPIFACEYSSKNTENVFENLEPRQALQYCVL